MSCLEVYDVQKVRNSEFRTVRQYIPFFSLIYIPWKLLYIFICKYVFCTTYPHLCCIIKSATIRMSSTAMADTDIATLSVLFGGRSCCFPSMSTIDQSVSSRNFSRESVVTSEEVDEVTTINEFRFMWNHRRHVLSIAQLFKICQYVC